MPLSPPSNDRRWLPCKNAGSADIASYTLVQVVDTEIVGGRPVLKVETAGTTSVFTHPLAALGPARLRPNMLGYCTMQWPAWVRSAGGTFAGQVLGPSEVTNGELTFLGQGLVMLGDAVPDPWRTLAAPGYQYSRPRKVRFKLSSFPVESTQPYEDHATLVDKWDGYAPQLTTFETVWNPPISQNYMFDSDAFQYGLATYDPVRARYWILTMECR